MVLATILELDKLSQSIKSNWVTILFAFQPLF
jgi:hypothetical protein